MTLVDIRKEKPVLNIQYITMSEKLFTFNINRAPNFLNGIIASFFLMKRTYYSIRTVVAVGVN